LGLEPVEKIANDKVLVDIARRVLGPEAFPYRATLFEKSATANWLVVWHQDTALPLRQRLNVPSWRPWSIKEGIDYAHAPAVALSGVLALRVHLDDSTLENGPLRVLPRTHNLGVLSDDRIQELAKEISGVDCVCPKGGVVAMKPLLVHASSKSKSEIPRRVLHIEYAAAASITTPLQLAIT
jgi:ectoine hydroxylase-related dioxygenase (phytanoyl-CoA dioxygenase family)